jgi:hypothetical protein
VVPSTDGDGLIGVIPMTNSQERWIIERLNRRGESVHYLANAFYLDDNYTVTSRDKAHVFRTYDDALRAVSRVDARGISVMGLDIVPCQED